MAMQLWSKWPLHAYPSVELYIKHLKISLVCVYVSLCVCVCVCVYKCVFVCLLYSILSKDTLNFCTS